MTSTEPPKLTDTITTLVTYVEKQSELLNEKLVKLKTLDTTDKDFMTFEKNSAEISKGSSRLKTGIDELKKNPDFLALPNVIKNNLLDKYITKFSNIVEEYTEISTLYHKKYTHKQTERLKCTLGDSVNEQQIKYIVESGSINEVIAKVLMSDKIEDVLENIKGRHNRILHLENTVLEVNQLVKDVVLLLDAQQEKLDKIQIHIENAKDKVNDGEKEIGSAKKYAKKTRKISALYVVS